MNSYVSLNALGEQVYIEGIPSSYIARLNSNQQNTAINVRLAEAGHLRPTEADLIAGRMAGLMTQQDQNALMNQGYAEIIGPYQIQAYDPNLDLKNYGQAAVEYLQQLNIRSRRNQRGLEDKTQRTVYITSLDQKVTEAQLASYFMDCGEVSDCRVCGDPNSATRFAFIEFAKVEGAKRALDRTGAILGSLPLQILPSRTAIVPVKRELMPASQDDMERCSRTVYVTNIDKSVERVDV
ncbi:hypothetical protein CEUSTIGMA_g11129.t1 [Chlamydomonas eustigma]|uniref:RRM domain-containing protein n=1 Tax=Chlamydomonas eustigma TaxID=1157962 RepID=A0A250XKV0_9CHLO|nr:hypothetical protein CEUSTIGMA_g11129.t1 [Chlamydomonas eustigma]|eukprot:GAX83704.1 hypothetical protein CEUSTIGMA_g11129.t1 [Chlamydomonas eustigma]